MYLGGTEFGFRTDMGTESGTIDQVTLTYYQGTEMYQCLIQGNGQRGVDYACDTTNKAETTQCISSEDKYGLQISINEINTAGDIDDLRVAYIIINGDYLGITGEGSLIGDRTGSSTNINKLYFDLGNGPNDLPSSSVSIYVNTIPICYTQGLLIILSV